MTPDMKRLVDAAYDAADEYSAIVDYHSLEAIVRAVLTEMREPSQPVLRAMCKAMAPEHRPTPERVGSNEKYRIRWRAAVDALLAGGAPTTESDPQWPSP